MKYRLVAFLFFVSVGFSFSQSDSLPKNTNRIGVNAGFTTGVGLTYRHWHNKIGCQLTVAPFRVGEGWSDLAGVQTFLDIASVPYSDESSSDDDDFDDDDFDDFFSSDEHSTEESEDLSVHLEPLTFISLGLTPMLKLKERKNYCFYTYWGNHLLINDFGYVYNTGVGFGFQVNALVAPSLMLGYQCMDVTNSANILPTIELSMLITLNR